MTEQLHAKERSLAKPSERIKGALRNPKTYGLAIGAIMAYYGCFDLFKTSNEIDRKLDHDYPSEAVRLAQREIVVFKKEVLKSDFSEQTNPQAVQAIHVAKQQEQRVFKQRELESKAIPRQVLLIFGGTFIELVAIKASTAISALRGRNEIHKETSKEIVKG